MKMIKRGENWCEENEKVRESGLNDDEVIGMNIFH